MATEIRLQVEEYLIGQFNSTHIPKLAAMGVDDAKHPTDGPSLKVVAGDPTYSM